MITEYDDNTELTFGQHNGVKLANVPASYLLWYYDAPGIKNVALVAYIKANMVLLLQEKDLTNIKRHGRSDNR